MSTSSVPPTDSSGLIAPPPRKGRRTALIVGAVVAAILAGVGVAWAVSSANQGAANQGTSNQGSANQTDGNANADEITSGKGSASDPVKIGVVGKSDSYWADFEKATKDAGIHVKLVDFTDYAQVNPALTEKELDLNQFQHLVYLAQYNETAGADLTPIGATATYPLALYSSKYDAVADIPAGATIAVPNDSSNLARSLLVLQSAKLITLKDGGSIFSTLNDIDAAQSKVTVTALEAALTPSSLPDVAAAIINNDFVADAGLQFSDAIATDDATDPKALPYVNVFVARAADADNELFQRLVSIYQSDAAVQQGVQKVSGNTAVLLKTPAADLVASLAEVQSDIRKQG